MSLFNISDAYDKLCLSDTLTNINVKVFNLMWFSDQTKHIEWHEIYKCRYECRELIDKGICDKGFIWNPINCSSECDKTCDIGEYVDYQNCKCRRKIVGELVKECNKNIDENKMIYNEALNGITLSDYKKLFIAHYT